MVEIKVFNKVTNDITFVKVFYFQTSGDKTKLSISLGMSFYTILKTIDGYWFDPQNYIIRQFGSRFFYEITQAIDTSICY